MPKVHELITKKTWKRGKAEKGACCVGQWIENVYQSNADRIIAIVKIAGRVHPKVEGYYMGAVIGWNDAPERTFEEVLAILKELDI